MRKVKVSAPGKLMLFGEHAVIYDRPCIVTAVDHRISTQIKLTDQSKIIINAPEVGVENYQKEIGDLGLKSDMPKGVRFVETAIRNFYDRFQIELGLEVATKSEFSSKFGFGSSSAVTVGTLKALSLLTGIELDKKQLFDLAYKSVLDVQGVGSGFDIAAGIWGGTLYFVTGGKEIVPLKNKNLSLVVGYTGIKADTGPLVRQVAELRKDYPNIIDRVFDVIDMVTEKAKLVLNGKDLNLTRLGDLMNLNQGLLDSLGVNTIELSKLIFAVRKRGAEGAKLSGAGGGDCMIAVVKPENIKRVERAIKDVGGQIISVKTGAPGVRKEKINESNS